MHQIKICVHDSFNKQHSITLTLPSAPTNPIISHLNQRSELDIFKSTYRVHDVWRYVVAIKNNTATVHKILRSEFFQNSEFEDRQAIDAIGSRIILIILESPHTNEYTPQLQPKGPAQGTSPGDAGGGIQHYITHVLKNAAIADGVYNLLISNPIPYMCSLGMWYGKKLNKAVRDCVWNEIWNISTIQEDFASRLVMYQPEIVINCCTIKLRDSVTRIIKTTNISKDNFLCAHPAVQWNIQKNNIEVLKIC